MKSDLPMEMFHCSGTKKNEETNPERSSLEGNRFIEPLFAFFCIIGLEEHRVEEEREKTEDEKQLDKEDGQIVRMMLNPASGLRGDDLIDIVQIDPAGKQQDHEQNASDFLVMLIKRIGNWLDLVPRDRHLQPWCYGDDEERQPTNPDDRRHQVKPMIDDRDECMGIGNEALKGVHLCNS
jgi:hypothetical protein